MKHTLVKPFRFYCCKENKLVDSAKIPSEKLGEYLAQYPKLADNIKAEPPTRQKAEPTVEKEK